MSGMLDLSKDENATCPLELQRRRKHFEVVRMGGWGEFAPMKPEGGDNAEDGVVQGVSGGVVR